MTGTLLSIDTFGDDAIVTMLNGLIDKPENIEPALREIGEHLIESTQNRMAKQVAPNGEAWEPLSAKTIKQKAKSGQSNKVLRGFGTLADTLNYQINQNQLTFGSNMEYAATHHFGRLSANIPQRELIGLSSDDNIEILDILTSHLTNS